MALELKPYRLVSGEHRVPNPDFKEGMEPTESHKIAKVGDVVYLNDDQYKAFKDKFRPISVEGTDVRDDAAKQFAEAKAAAAVTGESIDPNKPIADQVKPAAPAPQAKK